MGLNLLFFTRRLAVGGCQINAINLAVALVRQGHRVTFMAEEGPLVDQVLAGGMDFEHIDYIGRRHPSLKVMRKLADQVKKSEIDVVQAFDPQPIMEAYGSQMWHKQPVYGLVAAPYLPSFRLPKSREIALVNPNHREQYIRLMGWKPDRLRLVVARLDCERYKPKQTNASVVFGKYGVDSRFPIITLVTRVHPDKWPAIELFLSAVQRWQETRSNVLPAQFLVVGGGPLFSQLKERVAPLSNRGILFATGEILDIPQVMNASTLVLGMASTCQQALACGRPVIVLGERGFSDICQPSNFEFLSAHHFNVHQQVDDEQPESLCRQIERIISSPNLAAQLGTFGREVANEHFDSEIGARQLEDVYKRLIEAETPVLTERISRWTDLFLSLRSYYAHKLQVRLQRMVQWEPAPVEEGAAWLRAR